MDLSALGEALDGGDRRLLVHKRVVQRNLVYLVGMSLPMCREDVRTRERCFELLAQARLSAARGLTASAAPAHTPPFPPLSSRS
jgi:hypothetical protein